MSVYRFACRDICCIHYEIDRRDSERILISTSKRKHRTEIRIFFFKFRNVQHLDTQRFFFFKRFVCSRDVTARARVNHCTFTSAWKNNRHQRGSNTDLQSRPTADRRFNFTFIGILSLVGK